ncbi:adenine deaminase [Coraliomargarita akajimensis]|uniref:Adenine deaminase n=1 Tax=Coraliomargarita akajimensis (strain DSM 45221 / IAM 15411 / JCM 23193 / KCTC 12865 / 04OKA010-24) TaxID=583355 RepID=D5EQA3_CORAD|nr:adenine deaminase [Coraliomargarita akajimensis]ADE53871.1 adenine deaminase [Coraliomargarita akajimensis DSM 45221]
MLRQSFELSGHILDLVHQRQFPGTIQIVNGRITAITETTEPVPDRFYSCGLVDAHVHIESSLLAPSAFARAASIHGSVATVSDPHEIANVLGIPGVEWMLENASQSLFKFFFGAPSCVPATAFETAGASFGPEEIDALLKREEIGYLAEVMNFPAVIARDPRMMAIIDVAKRYGKHIDGHAPGVTGTALEQYIGAGIETDHECVTEAEGRERLELGMKVAIREGSAARNFDALWPLVKDYPRDCMLCSDDKHPDDLIVGHINQLVARLVANGIDPLIALRTASINTIDHYELPVGRLCTGDPADIVEWSNLTDFTANRVWIDGHLVAEAQSPQLTPVPIHAINRFDTAEKEARDFLIAAPSSTPTARVIRAFDGQLITASSQRTLVTQGGYCISSVEDDLLKIAVVNRYADRPPAVGFVENFGLHEGAFASSVAHDSHNIVVVGVDDHSIARAVNLVIQHRGGLSAAIGTREQVLPLPIAGLMSDGDAWQTGQQFEELTKMVRASGCPMRSPFMTLSFMALLVIPELKIGDLGLFDVNRFQATTLFPQ